MHICTGSFQKNSGGFFVCVFLFFFFVKITSKLLFKMLEVYIQVHMNATHTCSQGSVIIFFMADSSYLCMTCEIIYIITLLERI